MSDTHHGLIADGGIPKEQSERFEWILQRAEWLDSVRGDDWIADEIQRHWENPEGYEDGGMYEKPDGVPEKDYALFKLALNFGVDYEHYYPRDGDWRDNGE